MNGGGFPAGVTATRSDGAVIVRLTGELDAHSSLAVAELMRAETAGLPPFALVVLDLCALELVGSAGARALAGLVAECAAREVAVRLAIPPESVVRRVLAIAELTGAVPLFDDPEQALRAR